MFGGAWRLHQELEYGTTRDTSGAYSISGDRITFMDLQDPGCFGLEYSVQWTLKGTTLSLTDYGHHGGPLR